MPVNQRKAALFVAVSYATAILMGLAFRAAQGMSPLAALAVAIAYMFGPALAAVIVQRLYAEGVAGPLEVRLRPNRWFLAAWLIPPALALAALGVALLLPGVSYAPGMDWLFERFSATLTPQQLAEMRAQVAAMPAHPIFLALLQGLVAGATVNAVAAFGEELGWRGLLLRELLPLGFWRASLAIGLIWGFWHAPLVLQGHNYPQHPLPGVFVMTAFTLLLTPLISYVRLRARSVVAAALFHGTLNGTYGLSVMLIRGGSDLTVGLTGLAGLIALALANLLLYLQQRRRPA